MRRRSWRFRPPLTLLEREGFVLVDTRVEKGVAGNTVRLDRYAGPTVRAPDGASRGRADLVFNTARVKGLESKVRNDIDELIALQRRTDPEGRFDATEVEVRGRPGLLVHQDVGRFVVTATGDWRVQVSTGAPASALSDETLLAIASGAQVR